MRVFIEQHPNEDMRTAHVSKPFYHKQFSAYSGKGLPKKIQRLNAALANRVELSDTILQGVRFNCVSFERNKAFTWDDATTALVIVLEKYFGEPIELVVGERDPRWDIVHPQNEDGY